MKCPKVGCLHWIPRGCLYIGVHGGFTRVVVKRLGNKMTRLTPLVSGSCGDVKNYELRLGKYWPAMAV